MIDTFAIYSDLKESFGDEPARKMAGVIGQIYSELSQSVRRDDFNELKSVVAELAEAQITTGRRLDSLTVKVEELAEAQKRTEQEVRKLAKGLRETRQMVGGLSTVLDMAWKTGQLPRCQHCLRSGLAWSPRPRLSGDLWI